MRTFFVPQRSPLILSVSKDARADGAFLLGALVLLVLSG
jgi:hypothetical protein